MSDKQYPSNLYLESAATNLEFAKRVSAEAVAVMAKELLALRKAFSNPVAYEVNGNFFKSYSEAIFYSVDPTRLYRGPE